MSTMLAAIQNMFATSPRPRKRQRIESEVHQTEDAPSRTTRSTRKHASQAKSPIDANQERDREARVEVTTSKQGSELGNSFRSEFVDSAYQSMGASPDDEEEDAAVQAQTPSRRSKRNRNTLEGPQQSSETVRNPTAKRKPPDRPKADKHTPLEEENDKSSDHDNDEGTIVLRSSGRARTKTWKSAATENASRTSIDTKKASQKDKQSRTQSSLIAEQDMTPETPSKVIIGPTDSPKKGPLKMPSKRNQQADDADELREDGQHDPLSTPRKSRSTPSVEKSTVSSRTPRKSKSKKMDTLLGSRATESNVATSRQKAQENPAALRCSRLFQESKYTQTVLAMQGHIMRYLTGTGPLPICGEGHLAAYKKIYQILEQTIIAGEGNSMLLIGARATAKTTIIETALSELGLEYKDHFHSIRLNGLFHTDDKLALKEIWRQLGREMAVEDDSMNDRTNYADTLSSLLALLSQPEELSSSGDQRTTSKSVIFILDEFDRFTTHPRQTLLYNLFDIAQSRKAPIAVIGLTTRIDIVESLEKRVKSRFSHRYVHVSHPKSFSAFISISRSFLLASAGEDEYNKSPALEELRIQHAATFPELYEAWSSYVEYLLSDASVLVALNRQYSQTKSPQAFLNAFLLPVMGLPVLPRPSDLLVNTLASPDSNLHLLPSLSDASLAMLISAARLDVICDTDTVTFNMAYDEYTRLAQRSRLVASASGMIAVSGSTSGGSKGLLGREVALAAWERLEEIGLLLPIAGQGGQSQGATIDLGRGGRLVRVDVGLEEIGAAPGLELGPMLRWCKEI